MTAQRRGKKKARLAPVGMTAKLEAIAVVGDQLLAEIEAEAAAAPNPSQPPTLSTFCATVYRERPGVGDRTWRQRQYKVMGIMVDLGHLCLPDVKTPVVTRWLDRLRSEGAPLKAGGRGNPLGADACNDYLVTLRSIYKAAIFGGFVAEVPFANKPMKVEFDTDREAWTPTMKTRLLETAMKMDRGIFNLAKFLMLTGCRPEEALRLHWSDVIDIPVPSLRILGKGHRRRTLPLSGKLADFIRSLPRDGDAVFPVEMGKTAGKRYAYWPERRWMAACEAAKVPSPAYDLRHTFITEMVTARVPMALVAKWAGNSVRVIEAYYYHASPDHLAEVAVHVGRGMENTTPATSDGKCESADVLPDLPTGVGEG